ncbi:unnamed protein product [Ceratitis capitata]|uniref:(Mediterranean fruit fly) hypothetical protein n=1 Tax=Ceratitis capitata TaxID=7213 RepID=A0A811UPF6_CERCA|nr:unnamed protein product [Ceratitis capitata]
MTRRDAPSSVCVRVRGPMKTKVKLIDSFTHHSNAEFSGWLFAGRKLHARPSMSHAFNGKSVGHINFPPSDLKAAHHTATITRHATTSRQAKRVLRGAEYAAI